MDNKTLVNDASYLLSQTDARRFLRIERLGSTTWRKNYRKRRQHLPNPQRQETPGRSS